MRNKYIAALLCAVLSTAFVPTAASAYWTGGYEVQINGVGVANVKNTAKVTAMIAVVNDQLASAYGSEALLQPEIELKAKIMSSEKLSDDKQLHDAIASISEHMTRAYRISVNANETVCIESSDSLETVLELIIEKLGIAGADNQIEEDIDVKEEVIPDINVYSAEDAAEYLVKNSLVNVVSAVSVSKQTEYIPEENTVNDDSLYEGVREIITPGKNGSQILTETKLYTNQGLSDTKSASEIIDQGTPAYVRVGTKPRPAGVGSGSFLVPASGKLTSNFGARWGRNHNGIDIGASTGTPVYASDDGIVTCSEYKNSFGNLIKIDHQNGYETYYAHNSQLLVSEGETVKKGQLIAKVGSTGNSTGPHCHFEIHYKGEILNPSNYIK